MRNLAAAIQKAETGRLAAVRLDGPDSLDHDFERF
jgi:hypothetical protein